MAVDAVPEGIVLISVCNVLNAKFCMTVVVLALLIGRITGTTVFKADLILVVIVLR